MLKNILKVNSGITNLKSQNGIALIMVLGAIVIISAMAIEFAYNTNVNYHLAKNNLDRLKAEYLAKSAFRFMQVELKFDRLFRQVVQSQNLAQFLGSTANVPLCKQFPISTALIRAVFMGDKGSEALPDELKKMVSISQQEEAGEFLSFEGDFDGECIDESTKLNLNAFYGLNPLQKVGEGYNAYDRLKLDIQRFLSAEEYKETFEDLNIKVTEVVRNIADWVDTNEVINELKGVEAGSEISIYDRIGAQYPVKNSKLISLDEVFLIDGVHDSWFNPLKKYFTIYGDGLVNVCGAEDVVIQNVIVKYFEMTPNLPPIRLDDAETMAKLVSAVKDGCNMGGIGNQLRQQIVTSLNAAIGSIGGGEAQTDVGGSGFANYISSEPRFFSLLLTGMVGDIAVKIKAVIDVKSGNPAQWRLLYWRIY